MKPAIRFKFEKLNFHKRVLDYHEGNHINRDNIGNFMMKYQKGFRFSQVVDTMLYYYINNPNSNDTMIFEHIDENNGPYIIPVAVQYHPLDWSDVDNNGNKSSRKQSVFEFINPKYLQDLQQGRALLLIDQSVEGYSAKWLWSWFHKKCAEYNLDPACIIYTTGDQKCVDTYQEWCNLNSPKSKLKLIPSISLSMYIHKHCIRYNICPNFDDLITYKNNNSRNLYLYDCTNMRPRPQRVINFLHLLNAGLIDEGNISMPKQSEWDMYIKFQGFNFAAYKLPVDILTKLTSDMTPRTTKFTPKVSDSQYYNYVERVLDEMYKNSWVSLIAETSYYDREFSAFISEKSFKPIACMQPFITLGSKDSLKYLRRLGYKTFTPFIDESYDDASDEERFSAVINSLQKIKQIEDKVAWYNSMRPILEHNYSLFSKIGSVRGQEHSEIADYYYQYFKLENVS